MTKKKKKKLHPSEGEKKNNFATFGGEKTQTKQKQKNDPNFPAPLKIKWCAPEL